MSTLPFNALSNALIIGSLESEVSSEILIGILSTHASGVSFSNVLTKNTPNPKMTAVAHSVFDNGAILKNLNRISVAKI